MDGLTGGWNGDTVSIYLPTHLLSCSWHRGLLEGDFQARNLNLLLQSCSVFLALFTLWYALLLSASDAPHGAPSPVCSLLRLGDRNQIVNGSNQLFRRRQLVAVFTKYSVRVVWIGGAALAATRPPSCLSSTDAVMPPGKTLAF